MNIPECKSNKQPFAHLLFAISHAFQCHLLVMHLLILSHVGLVIKVIEIACVRLRVQLRHKRSPLLPQAWPLHFSEIGMTLDLTHTPKTLGSRRHKSSNEVPGALGQIVARILIDGLLQHPLPALKILPGLVNGSASEGRITCERLKQHATQAPVVNREVIFVTLQYFWRHVVWTAYDALGVIDVALPQRTVSFASLGGRTLLHWPSEWHGHVADRLELDAHGLYFS